MNTSSKKSKRVSKKKGAFDAQTFLDSAGVSRKVRLFKRADIIFSQGTPANSVMYIQEGAVKITAVSEGGKEAIITILGPGDFFNALRVELKSLIAEGKKQIVLNMDNIKYIDSAGLGILVAAHVNAKTQGASLRLCHLGSKFQEVLQITKLVTVFEVYDTERAAIASFSG
jgi:anti-sigma B factor antagonist